MCNQCGNTQQKPMSKYRKKRQQENPNVYVGEWSPNKVCGTCGQEKDKSEFYAKKSRNKTSLCSVCKSCETKAVQEYRLTTEGRALNLVSNAKNRAAKKKVAFDLDVEWLEEKLIAGVCEGSGHTLDISGGTRGAFTPSLDRHVPELGYTKDNTKVVCWMYNACKGISTREDVIKFVRGFKV